MRKIYALLRLKKLLIAYVERLSAFKKCKIYKLRGITEILKFSSAHFTQ